MMGDPEKEKVYSLLKPSLKKCGGEGQSEEQEEKLKQKPCDGRGAMTWVTSGVWHLVHGRK